MLAASMSTSWLIVGACAMTVVASSVPESQRDAVEELVLKRIGTTATICGRFRYQFIRGNKPTPAELRGLETCITDAWRAQRAFFFSIEGSGIDSYVANGLMGDGAGQIRRFWYDSAPCGRPGCAERFLVWDCAAPPPETLLDPYLECPRK